VTWPNGGGFQPVELLVDERPLLVIARIELGEGTVTWRDLQSLDGDAIYPLGPFVFDRGAYEAALRP
jgi:hypothetical protein